MTLEAGGHIAIKLAGALLLISAARRLLASPSWDARLYFGIDPASTYAGGGFNTEGYQMSPAFAQALSALTWAGWTHSML